MGKCNATGSKCNGASSEGNQRVPSSLIVHKKARYEAFCPGSLAAAKFAKLVAGLVPAVQGRLRCVDRIAKSSHVTLLMDCP